jgi:hypothetical protein
MIYNFTVANREDASLLTPFLAVHDVYDETSLLF